MNLIIVILLLLILFGGGVWRQRTGISAVDLHHRLFDGRISRQKVTGAPVIVDGLPAATVWPNRQRL
jgi:hypothetical protein